MVCKIAKYMPNRISPHYFRMNKDYMKTAIAYTESTSVIVPEKQFTSIPEGYHTVALRGYGFVKAVMNGNHCVGWICCKE